MWERDLVGYGSCPPHPRWPHEARVAVWICRREEIVRHWHWMAEHPA
jgi:hypothetical protein